MMYPERDEYMLVYDYGQGNGFEVLCTEYSLPDIKRAKQEYIEKHEIYPAIVRKKARKENRRYDKAAYRAS